VKRLLATLVGLILCAAAVAQGPTLEQFRRGRIDKLIKRLGSDNARVRGIATRQIVSMEQLVVPRLLKELSGSDGFIRDQVIAILNSMGVKEAVPRYIQMLPRAVKRQFKYRHAVDIYRQKRELLERSMRDKKDSQQEDYRNALEDLKKRIPRRFGGAEFEVAQLAKGIGEMGDGSHVAALARILLDSRKDDTVYEDNWQPAWGPCWQALEKLVAKTEDPEVLRACVTTLDREAQPVLAKTELSKAEANYVVGFWIVDLLVDARIEKVVYKQKDYPELK